MGKPILYHIMDPFIDRINRTDDQQLRREGPRIGSLEYRAEKKQKENLEIKFENLHENAKLAVGDENNPHLQ